MALNKITTLKAFCDHAHITRARATQIMNTLFLSPRIQTQILVGDNATLNGMHEAAIRPLLKEVFWQRQEALWRKTLISIGHGTETMQ